MVELASANAGAEAARMRGTVDAAKDVRLQVQQSSFPSLEPSPLPCTSILTRSAKKKWQGAHDLARLLGLDAPPRRIEAFDISHTLGEGTVASRVVLIDGVPAKHLYRTYNIATVDGIDDYKSMQEVVQRRFARSTSSSSSSSSPGDAADSESNELPDLVVIDGGKGQV
jgi:excinuclease ABC subunit C